MQIYVRAIEDVAETWSSIRQIPDYEIVVGEALFRHLFELEPAAVKLYSFGREKNGSERDTSTDNNNSKVQVVVDIDTILQTPGFKVHAIGVVAMLGAVVGMMATAASTSTSTSTTGTTAKIATANRNTTTTAHSSTNTPTISWDNGCCCSDTSCCCCNSSIETVVSVEDDILSELAQSIASLGSRHVHYYGVVPAHFNILETALLRTLQGGLEPLGRWTTNARKGWSAVLKFIATAMQQGAVVGRTIQIIPPTTVRRPTPPPPKEEVSTPPPKQRSEINNGGLKDRLPTTPSRERSFVHTETPGRSKNDEAEDTDADDEEEEDEEHEAKLALKVLPTPSSPPPPPSKLIHRVNDADVRLLSMRCLDPDGPPTSRRRWSSDGGRPTHHHDHHGRRRRPSADHSPSPPSRSKDHTSSSLLELPFHDECHPNDRLNSNIPLLPPTFCTMKRRQSEPGIVLTRPAVDFIAVGVVASTKYCVDQAPRMPRRNSDLPLIPSASAAAAAAAYAVDSDDDDVDSDYDNEHHDSKIPFRSKQNFVIENSIFDSSRATCGDNNFMLSTSLSPSYYDPKSSKASSPPKRPERSPSPTIPLYISSYSPPSSSHSVVLPSSAPSSPSMIKSTFVRRIDSLPVLPRRFDDDEEDVQDYCDHDDDDEDLKDTDRDVDDGLPLLSTAPHNTTPSQQKQKQKRFSVTTAETVCSSPGPEDSDDDDEGDDEAKDDHE